MTRLDPALAMLVDGLDEAFDHQSWHGTNLRGSMRGLDAREATWRPARGRHNIWEIAVHAAYWKYAVRRRLRGEKRGTFALGGSNWLVRPVRGTVDPDTAWAADSRALIHEHLLLRETVVELDPTRLFTKLGRSKVTPAYLLRGIIAHDLYHAGQIQVIKRLMPTL